MKKILFKGLPVLIGLVLVLLFVGCKEGTTTETTLPVDETQNIMVSQSKADLAQRLKITEDEIDLISIQEVKFNDTSLGVLEPDKVYTEVITPGYIIKLEVNGSQYQYNTDQQATVKLYTAEGPTVPEDFTIPVDPK